MTGHVGQITYESVLDAPSERLARVVGEYAGETPRLVVDLDVVANRYDRLEAALPEATVHYAVKANPLPEVLRLLVERGCSFDVASPGEIDACLAVGADPAKLSYGNTVKKRSAIRDAHARGVRLFAFDSDSELDKLVDEAPGSTVFCRILCDGLGSAWPLSRKFGCEPVLAVPLLCRAARAGLGIGVSFHVGSQQFRPDAWDRALESVAELAADLHRDGIELDVVNIGGGLPATYLEPSPPIEDYGRAIGEALRARLGDDLPFVIIEPGRYLVADAGMLAAEVVAVGRKALADERRWVYLDIGIFGGLAEALGEAIRYRIRTPHDGGPTGPVVLAGPTCDSADILYETFDYQLPLALAPGDRVELLSVGAYSTTYSSVGFNGFPPLAHDVLPLGL